jgi:hypothetical protein
VASSSEITIPAWLVVIIPPGAFFTSSLLVARGGRQQPQPLKDFLNNIGGQFLKVEPLILHCIDDERQGPVGMRRRTAEAKTEENF